MISIIIVTYNSQEVIDSCLRSIQEKYHSATRPLEIIVVDNNSLDTTRDRLQELKRTLTLPITLIFSKKNSGFTGGCNEGARHALGEYFLFLNPDTQIRSSLEDSVLDELTAHPSTILGFHFLNPDGSLQPSAGNAPTFFRVLADRLPFLSRRHGLLIRDEKFYQQRQECDWVSGSGLMISRSLFKKSTGFNEHIFMYGDDLDLCYRAHQNGARILYTPALTFTHNDTGKNNPLRKPHKYYSMRRGLLVFFKNYRSDFSYWLLQLTIKTQAFFLLFWFRLTKTRVVYTHWQPFLKKTFLDSVV